MQIFQTALGPRHHVAGVVSFGFATCGMGPAVYTRVTHYLPFILDNLSMQ